MPTNGRVNVEVILDESQRTEKHSSADFLRSMGSANMIDAKSRYRPQQGHDSRRASRHHRLVQLHQGGRGNNAENLLVIRDPQLAAKYAENWNRHAAHAKEYGGRAEDRPEAHPPISTSPLTLRRPAITTGFIASKNSQVFHRPNCESGSKILPKNIVRYTTREEAIQRRKEAVC